MLDMKGKNMGRARRRWLLRRERHKRWGRVDWAGQPTDYIVR